MAKLTANTYDSIVKFLNGRYERKIGNNTVASRRGPHGFDVTLHNHRIVSLWIDHAEFTLAGYPTVTSRERVNHFLNPLGFRISQRNYTQMLTRLSDGASTPISPSEVYTICGDSVMIARYNANIEEVVL